MSIIKKKSQDQHKSVATPSLIVALDIAKSRQKKKQKMAEGGKVKSDFDHGQKRGPEGYPKYQEQAQNEKGVHRPVSGVTVYPGGKGTSRAGDYVKEHYDGKPFWRGKDSPAIEEHKKVIEEAKKIKPKLQGLANGGLVKPVPIKHPKMVKSDVFSVKLRDQENDLQEYAEPMKYEGMSEDKKPSKEEIMESHFAEGGKVAEPDQDKAKAFSQGFNEGGPSMGEMYDNLKKAVFKAEGGEICDEPEMEDEHYDSIASAIMAKRKKMAEGGRVDIDMNEEEQPNSFYKLNEHAALKENYDSDMDDVSQPMDSNEDSDDIESDKHDMISMIRRKMKSRMK